MMSDSIIGDLVTGDQLIEQFESGATSPESFHHAEHVRLAFAYLRRYPALEALRRFSAALQRFAAAQGKADRYHETITWAYLLLIRERMARGTGDAGETDWEGFIAANSDLLVWKGGALAALYRPETLDSDLARRIFVMPDGGRDARHHTRSKFSRARTRPVRSCGWFPLFVRIAG